MQLCCLCWFMLTFGQYIVEIFLPVTGFWNSSGYFLFTFICSPLGICDCLWIFLPLIDMHHQYLLKVEFLLFCFVVPKEQFVINAVDVSFGSRLEILEIPPTVGTGTVASLLTRVGKVFWVLLMQSIKLVIGILLFPVIAECVQGFPRSMGVLTVPGQGSAQGRKREKNGKTKTTDCRGWFYLHLSWKNSCPTGLPARCWRSCHHEQH